MRNQLKHNIERYQQVQYNTESKTPKQKRIEAEEKEAIMQKL